ncbi:MAG: FHA domain-containing protein [Myxococcales bacterium]
MARRPDEDPKSEELIELHTGDVQLLTNSGETPIATAPVPEKPFDPDATMPMPDPSLPEKLLKQTSFDPESTDKGSFRAPKELPDRSRPPEEMLTDPTGRSQQSQPSDPLRPARLFDGVPPSTSGERPLFLGSRTVLPPPPPVTEPAFLCVTRGPGQGTSVAVPEGEHPIGRSANCFLCLAHSSISREHALFKRVGNQFYIRDAASGGGTKINGVRLEGTAEVVPGDQIQIGAAVLVLRHGPVIGAEMTDPQGFSIVGQQPRKSSAWLWAGAIATAFASAAFASVVLTPVGERLFQGRPRPVAMPATPAAVTAPPSIPRPTGEPEVEVDAADVNLDGEVQIKSARHGDPAAAGTTDVGPALEPVIARPQPKATPRPRPKVDPTAALVPPPPSPPPAPKPAAPTTKASEALRLFNEGEVEASIEAAKSSNSSALALKLASFRKEVALAQTSRTNGDALSAVRHLSAAAATDESLTRGWSKPGTEVRAELTRLLIELSEKALGSGDAAQAAVFAEKALVYGPGNEKAGSLLKDAKAKKAGGAPAKDPRSEADKAFDN